MFTASSDNRLQPHIDLARSRGIWLHDLTTHRPILDLHNQFSSLPLGYNPPLDLDLSWARHRISTRAYRTTAHAHFLATFPHPRTHPHIHLTPSGALAVEAAIKSAMCLTERCTVGVHPHSFHGVYGYPGLVAAADSPARARLYTLPSLDILVLDDTLDDDVLAAAISKCSCVLIEPLYCTAGDLPVPTPYLRRLSHLCHLHNTPLILDEIQTGFGAMGTWWHHTTLDLPHPPTFITFGKRAQVSGVMSTLPLDLALLSCTFDGDVMDMVRSTAITHYINTHDVLSNVRERADQLAELLNSHHLPVRTHGLMAALDFTSRAHRDAFVTRAHDHYHVLTNPTGDRCVRLRWPLNTTANEIELSVDRLAYAYADTTFQLLAFVP